MQERVYKVIVALKKRSLVFTAVLEGIFALGSIYCQAWILSFFMRASVKKQIQNDLDPFVVQVGMNIERVLPLAVSLLAATAWEVLS